ATNLSVSEAAADALLEGEVALTGRVARTERGIETEDFFIGNDRVALTADGLYASGAADFCFGLDLADLAFLNEQMSGALTATGTAIGGEGRIALNIDASVPDGSLAGRTLRRAAIGFEGTSEADRLVGTLSGSAFLD